MNVEKIIPDHGLSTAFNQAQTQLGVAPRIDAFVEGYDDIGFWTAVFAKFNLNVTVQAIADIDKANGKGTIIRALVEARITLGPKTLVCIDSDYDYLLDKDYTIKGNISLYQSDFCFQTYSYAIENYYYNPIGLTHVCCTAARDHATVDNRLFERILNHWSNDIYGRFVDLLNTADDSETQVALKASIVESLNVMTLAPPIEQATITGQQASDFTSKGLTADNVFAFFRGHDLESRLKVLTVDLVKQLKANKKAALTLQHSENAQQMIGEYFNHCLDVTTLIKSRSDFELTPCFALVQRDIQRYIHQQAG